MPAHTNVLALETSSETLSIALACGAGRRHRVFRNGPPHSERILGVVAELLDEAGLGFGGLDAIAFGAGPGAFTGVRLGCGVAQGLALARDLPVVPVNSLLGLAVCAHDAARNAGEDAYPTVVSAIDARLGEVYWNTFDRSSGAWRERGATRLAKPGEIDIPADGRWLACGNAFAMHADALRSAAAGPWSRAMGDALPDARGVLAIAIEELAAGRGLDAGQALPLYVRDKVALTIVERADRARAGAPR